MDVVAGPTTGGVILAFETARQMGIELVESTPDQAKAFYLGEMAFWAPIVKASGIKVE